MPETVLVRTASGVDMVHDLPLPDGLAKRVAKGEEIVLGPCDADGVLLVEDDAPAPAKKATSRLSKRTQDAGGQSADDDPPTDAPAK